MDGKEFYHAGKYYLEPETSLTSLTGHTGPAQLNHLHPPLG
jgi:hypothetical protein